MAVRKKIKKNKYARKISKKKAQKKIKRVSRKKTGKKAGRTLFAKRELNKFKKLLIRLKGDLLDEIDHIAKGALKTSQRDASGDLSGYTFHMADMASDHYDREFSLGIASGEQKTIYEIEEAFKRIEEGTFGICFSCEKHISRRRLKAVPYAKHCIKCQEKEELIQKKGIT